MVGRLASRAVLLGLAIGILELGAAALGRSVGVAERLRAVSLSSLGGERSRAQARIGHMLPDRTMMEESIHPYLGFAVIPSDEALAEPLSLAALGLPLGGPLIRERRDDTVAIGIFGGSVAYYFAKAGGVERVFAGLQSLPRFAGKQLAVIGGAHIGYKQPQSLMALAYLSALGAQLDVVIVLDGFNEVVAPSLELIPAGVFPFLPGRWHQRVANLDAATDLRARIGEIAFLAERRSALATALLDSPLRHSRTVTLCWALLDRFLEARVERLRVELATRRASERLEYAASGPRWQETSQEATREELAAFWMQSSLAMRALAESRGALFFHFLQPNQHVRGSKPIGEDERAVAIAGGELVAPVVQGSYPALQARGAELRAQGVRFHDLTRVFAEVEEPIYVDNVGHVGARGNEILADAIAAAVREDLAEQP